MNLTELLALPVIHLPTATQQGVVSGFGISEDGKRMTHVIVIDEDSYCRESYYAWEDIKVGKDALCCVQASTQAPLRRIPFRGAIYDTDGTAHGYLQDLTCMPKGRVVQFVSTLQQTWRPAHIVSVGDVVVCKGHRKVRIQSTPKDVGTDASLLSTPTEKPDAAIGDVQPTEANHPQANAAPEIIPADLPEGGGLRKLLGDYSFLLGRTLRSDLVQNGQVLFRQGSVIDVQTVQTARDNGLLLTLTVLSR